MTNTIYSSGNIEMKLHHAPVRLMRHGGSYWLNAVHGNIEATIFMTPAALLGLAAQIVEQFGPLPVASADVSNIEVGTADVAAS